VIVAIGSWALRRLTRCKVADLDLIASPDEREGLVARSSRVVSDSESRTVTVNGGRRVEVEWALPGTSAAALLFSELGEAQRVPGVGTVRPAGPDPLCAVYASTCLFPVQWDKNYSRYRDLRAIGARPDPSVMRLRTAEIAARFRYKASSYDRPNADFFRDSVKREIPHDRLHLELKFGERPAYESLKRDLSRSGICLDLFEAMTREEQLRCVWEEALVLGHERFRVRGHGDEDAVKRVMRGLVTRWYPLDFRPAVLDLVEEATARFPYSMWKDMDARRSA